MKKYALGVVLLLATPFLTLAQVYDICVYGGTSAGVIAAYTAKKAGKSVLLIEPSKHLGGLSAGGLGQTDIGNKYAITGIAREFYRKIGRHYGKFEQWTFEPHVSENLFKNYVKEAGIVVWYEHRLLSVNKKQGVKIAPCFFVISMFILSHRVFFCNLSYTTHIRYKYFWNLN